MSPWWVRISNRDLADVTLVSEDTDEDDEADEDDEDDEEDEEGDGDRDVLWWKLS